MKNSSPVHPLPALLPHEPYTFASAVCILQEVRLAVPGLSSWSIRLLKQWIGKWSTPKRSSTWTFSVPRHYRRSPVAQVAAQPCSSLPSIQRIHRSVSSVFAPDPLNDNYLLEIHVKDKSCHGRPKSRSKLQYFINRVTIRVNVFGREQPQIGCCIPSHMPSLE